MRNQNVGAASEGGDPKELADYVATVSRELSALSRRSGLTTLAYLLDMARLEAETIKHDAGRDGGRQRPSEKTVGAT